MKGQLRFDELMNISEEQLQYENAEYVVLRTPMVDPCYYCMCNSCINNAESGTITPDELPYDWDPCFFCDDCKKYDADMGKRNMEREQCAKYKIDNYHAEQNRKKLRVVR